MIEATPQSSEPLYFLVVVSPVVRPLVVSAPVAVPAAAAVSLMVGDRAALVPDVDPADPAEVSVAAAVAVVSAPYSFFFAQAATLMRVDVAAIAKRIPRFIAISLSCYAMPAALR